MKLKTWPLILILLTAACGVAGAGETDDVTRSRHERWLQRQRELRDNNILRHDTVLYTGDPSRRVDIVLLSDGYDRSELDGFRSLTDNVARSLINLTPFNNFKNYINVHRLFVESQPGEFEIGSNVGQREILICDFGKAVDLASFAPDVDLIVVVSNVRSARARSTAAGPIVTLSARGGVTNVLVHEFGHAFGHLADEYVERFGHDIPPAEEPNEVNVTLEPVPQLCKWHYWCMPTTSRGRIVNAEGAMYVSKGVYRPEANCVMRHGGTRFCLVCNEQMVRSFFKYIPPIDQQRPNSVNVIMCAGEEESFQANALEYEVSARTNAKMNWRWYLDGEPAAPTFSRSAATVLKVEAERLETGTHELVVTCDMLDERIRRDLAMMSDARYWLIELLPYPRPTITAPEKQSTRIAETLAFEVKAADLQGGGFRFYADGLPRAATFDADTGTFTWTPAEGDAGAHLVDFIAANDKITVKAQTTIAVSSGTRARQPELINVVDEYGYEGSEIRITFQANDPEGRNIVFTLSGAPPAAEFNQRTGEFVWTPSFADAADYPLRVSATNGEQPATADIILQVLNQHTEDLDVDTFFDAEQQNFDHCMILRSTNPSQRIEAADQLSKTPIAFQVAQYTRLMRDNNQHVQAAVFTKIQELLMGENGKLAQTIFILEMADKIWQFTDTEPVLELMSRVRDSINLDEAGTLLRKAASLIDTDLKRAKSYNDLRQKLRERMQQ